MTEKQEAPKGIVFDICTGAGAPKAACGQPGQRL